MVDIERRKQLAFHLRQLSVGLTTNDDFENAIADDITEGWLPEQYHRSKNAKHDDAIIIPMLELSWTLYDDTRRHKLLGRYKLLPHELKLIARCILFLHSCQKYQWPYFDIKANYSLTDFLYAILTFGQNIKEKRAERKKFYIEWQRLGDFEVWPFYKHEQYQVELERQPFLRKATKPLN